MPPTVLTVIPHPDDESYSVAGTLALAARAGWRCVLVCASRGERGERHDGLSADAGTLGTARERELARSCQLLGIEPPTVWRYPDGALQPDDAGAVARLQRLLDEVRPDVVLSLGPDGGYGHPDHVAVHAWVVAATMGREVATLHAAFPPGLFVPQYEKCRAAGIMGTPPLLALADLGTLLADYEIGIAAVRDVKLASIAAHRTQLPGGKPEALFPPGIVSSLLAVERFVDGRGGPDIETVRLLQSLAEPAPRELA